MGKYDFTHTLPEYFESEVIQFLQQSKKPNLAEAFKRCGKRYKKGNFAYYDGIKKGDTWNKYSITYILEGNQSDINLLQSSESILREAIDLAINDEESGLLLLKIKYSIVNTYESKIIPSSNEERLDADISTSREVLDDLIKICGLLCSNSSFNELSSENKINDYFRDLLIYKGYNETKDQTRHGLSESKKDAGEVDLLLTKGNKEIALFEGLKLNGVLTASIDAHINKAIINYNTRGTPTFIVNYVFAIDFEEFWKKYSEHIKNYKFPLQVIRPFIQQSYPNASTRVADMILSRDGYEFPVYFIAVRLCRTK